ncbi:MAG: DUF4221 domain-containing protein [Cyclobacteriaceae bacterium]|nr:DUF4221 domain-containing protein [Cyclobacteriaceae bacterium]MDX5467497.1 DUF4221 domain-containing protein [Cyclobacteriaceae bacterium]
MRTCIYFAFLLGLVGCQKKSSPVQEFDLKQISVDTLVLEKDPMTKGLGSDFTYIETDTGQYLLTFNRHYLLFYSYPEGEIKKKSLFEEEGPDGIGSFISGSFISDSLIYFLSENNWIKCNFQGKVLDRTPLPEGAAKRLSVNYSTFPFNRIAKDRGKFLIADVPFVLKDSFLDYSQWILKYTPGSDRHEYVEFLYPSYYKGLVDDQTFSSYNFTHIPEKNEFLVSFPATDSILVITGNSQKWFSARPKEKMEFLVGTAEPRGEWIAYLPNTKSSVYRWIHFDPTAGKYYRLSVVRPDVEELQKEGISPLAKLLVFNDSYEKEAEVILPFPSSGFQTPDGFYYNIGYLGSEDKVGFVKFDFSKINP